MWLENTCCPFFQSSVSQFGISILNVHEYSKSNNSVKISPLLKHLHKTRANMLMMENDTLGLSLSSEHPSDDEAEPGCDSLKIKLHTYACMTIPCTASWFLTALLGLAQGRGSIFQSARPSWVMLGSVEAECGCCEYCCASVCQWCIVCGGRERLGGRLLS